MTLEEASLQYILRNPNFKSIVIGVKNKNHLDLIKECLEKDLKIYSELSKIRDYNSKLGYW